MTVKRQALKNVNTASWLFGHPTLRANNNSSAKWLAPSTSPLNQKGGGWLAEFDGGVQTGDDWAAAYVPVNELPVQMFEQAQWSYYMTSTQTMGVNIVIWVHDADDFDKRAEITLVGGHASLEKAAGWNAHEFTAAQEGMFFYGEGTGNSLLVAGTQYTWAQFQADRLFKDWVIYRITIEYGWEAAGTFNPAYLAELMLNKVPIPLVPVARGTHRKIVQTSKTMVADTKAAGDVYSESASTGTDWDWDFGGTGYITGGVIMHDAAITERFRLFLFSQPPTSVVNDNVANTSPVTADAAFFLGVIDFPALAFTGTGDAFTVASPSTTGNLPLMFDKTKVYGILVGLDGSTTVAEGLTISLSAEMEDN